MIRVSIELQSAITHETKLIGRLYIWNKGTGSKAKGDYGVAVARRGDFDTPFGAAPKKATRTGEVLNYPRLSYNVWRLITKALKSCFPEEV